MSHENLAVTDYRDERDAMIRNATGIGSRDKRADMPNRIMRTDT